MENKITQVKMECPKMVLTRFCKGKDHDKWAGQLVMQFVWAEQNTCPSKIEF